MDPARRREAVQRRRRIILNDDNGRLLNANSHTVEGYLSGPVGYTPLTQIDSIWLSVMAWAENLTYDTKVGEPAGLNPYPAAPKADVEHLRRLRSNIKSMLDAGTDPLKEVVDYGHAHGKEVFASFRMNMIKDSWRPNFSTRWKREHPECCLGLRGMFANCEPDDLHHHYWSALDYA